jgi:hypothetical protein
MRTKTIATLFAGLFLAGPLLAQVPVAPPPRPTDANPAPQNVSATSATSATESGPSMTDTVKFIEDKLNAQGKVTYLLAYQDERKGKTKKAREYTDHYTGVSVDAGGWILRYQKIAYKGEQVLSQDDLSFSFKEIQTIEVMNLEDFLNREAAADGHADSKVSIAAPTPFALVVTLKNNQRVHFLFIDGDLANRVARAMIHAVDLCGGPTGKEPF